MTASFPLAKLGAYSSRERLPSRSRLIAVGMVQRESKFVLMGEARYTAISRTKSGAPRRRVSAMRTGPPYRALRGWILVKAPGPWEEDRMIATALMTVALLVGADNPWDMAKKVAG